MIGWDRPDGGELRDRHREQHLAHIQNLESEGRIVFAGPIRSDGNDRSIGAVIVLEAGSLEEARRTVDRDPYVSGKVFDSITVSPFKQVVPKPR